MFKLIQLRTLPLVACCLLLSASAYADPIKIGFGENASAFSLTITDSAIDRDFNFLFLRGDFWEIEVTIIGDDDAITDQLHVSGTAQHIRAPHGEQPGQKFPFVFRIGRFQGAGFGLLTDDHPAHPPHSDLFIARLSFSGFNPQPDISQITSYNFHLEGRHCNECPLLPPETEIPEPATMLLLGTGLAGVAIKMRKRLKSHKSG